MNALKRISSTGDNLLGAAGGEHHEFSEMYPDFIKQAEAEGEEKALDSFGLANKVEKIHHGLFQAALGTLEKGQPAELKPIVVCHYCGNTIEGEAPENAPFAGHQRVCSG